MEVCVAYIDKVYAVVVLIKQCLICIFQILLTRVLILKFSLIPSHLMFQKLIQPERDVLLFIFYYSAHQLDYPLVCFLEF